MTAAADHVAASRERLRAAMAPKPSPRVEVSTGRRPSWLERLLHIPAVSMVVDTLSTWWKRHPLHHVAQVAEEASDAAVRPMAQRNPLLLVACAAAVGASLGWLRPWRWLFGSAIFAGIVPQLASQLISRLPIETWIKLGGELVAGQRKSRKAPAAPHQSATPPGPTTAQAYKAAVPRKAA